MKKKTKKQYKKTIFVFIFIIIGAFLIYGLFEAYTSNIINKQIRKENGTWIAKKTFINFNTDVYFNDGVEEEDDESPIFDSIYDFVPIDYDYSDLVPKNYEKNKNTGLFILSPLASNLAFTNPTFDFEDKINWEKYITKIENQRSCGSCAVFSMLGTIQTYINRKYNLKENKIDFSEQYLISYTNFSGCNGTTRKYYLNYLSLVDKEDNNFNDYLIKKIKEELEYVPEKEIETVFDLKKKTQLSLFVEEVPFGVPLEKELKYIFKDSCEIKEFNEKLKTTATNMIIEPLLDKKYKISLKNLDNNFCPDIKDATKTAFVPVKNDSFTKHFIEKHFQINTKKCNENKKKIITDIKESLKISPLSATIMTHDLTQNYTQGVYSPLIGENYKGLHGITIIGWGVEKERNKEYWIIANSWGNTWGKNGIGRVWIDDPKINLECNPIYGFSGNLIVKTGKEINELLPIAKKQIEEQKKNKDLNIMQEIFTEKIIQIPFNNESIYDDYKSIYDDYIPIEETSINNTTNIYECKDELDCITNKLQTFYD